MDTFSLDRAGEVPDLRGHFQNIIEKGEAGADPFGMDDEANAELVLNVSRCQNNPNFESSSPTYWQLSVRFRLYRHRFLQVHRVYAAFFDI